MGPRIASDYFTNVGLSNPVFIRDGFLGYPSSGIPLYDTHGVSLSYLGVWSQFTSHASAKPMVLHSTDVLEPSLSLSVLSVCHAITEKQVTWIAAFSVVAMVANKIVCWINPIMKKVRNSMRCKVLGLHLGLDPYAEVSIPTFVKATPPLPALRVRGNIYAIPEVLNLPGFKPRHSIKMFYSHLISLVDRWLGPCEIDEISRGSFYFCTSRGGRT